MYRKIMLRNKSIFQISTLICLSSISICNLHIDLLMYNLGKPPEEGQVKTKTYKAIFKECVLLCVSNI
jgi:hypothetical protein